MYPSLHAVRRYQERVAPVSTSEAFRRLASLSETAKIRATPRAWTTAVPQPGLRFAYPADSPGICLLVRDGCILTVLERAECRAWQTAEDLPERKRRRPAYHRPPAGTVLEEAA